MSRELLASQKNHSGIVLDPRTKLAVLTTIAVFILGGSYEGVMQYYIIVLAAIPLLLLLLAGKWKGAVLYLLIFGGSLCLELFGLSYLTGLQILSRLPLWGCSSGLRRELSWGTS